MTSRASRPLLASAALTLVLAVPALAQDAGAALDLDGDGTITRTEFRAAFGAVDAPARGFSRLDGDGDGRLDADEFASALYDLWETSGEGEMSVDEWDTGVDRWFGEDDVDLAVAEWDRDGDGIVGEDEFRAALANTNLFARFDASGDAVLDPVETADAAFDVGDTNADGLFADDDDDGFLTDLAEAFLGEDDPLDAASTDDAGSDVAASDPVDLDVDVPDVDVPDVDPLDDPLPEEPLIERGEAFVQLPLPCDGGGNAACEATAARFCEALGYEPPIDFVAVRDQLHVIRCADEF